MNQIIVTPESAKQPSPNVQEVSASVLVPAKQEGDQEAVKTFGDREHLRKPGEILPGNSHSEMRGFELAASFAPTFVGSHMSTVKLSAEEADLLEGLN